LTIIGRPEDRSKEPWTVLRLIRWTSEYFADKGIDTPRLDAEVLLADMLNLSRVQLYLNFDRPLEADELAGFRERVRRRAGREPVAYITRSKEFYSLDLEVGPAVLIPRPETELLVEAAVRFAGRRWPAAEKLRLLDLGVGSGAVTLALASELTRAEIWAVDLSAAALDVARRNARRHGLEGRIKFLPGDLFEALADETVRFHLMAANLPYVPRTAWEDMSPEVREYEPRLSLDGGEDGLAVIRRAVAQAGPWLESGGLMLLEIWPTHGRKLRELAARHGYNQVEIIKDLAGRDRVAVLVKEEHGG